MANQYQDPDIQAQASMPRSASFDVRRSTFDVRRSPSGYTLVEILVATTLTLVLMFAVVQIFAMIGDSVSDSRALLEASDRLRAAKTRLQMDLGRLTVVPLPPRSEANDGYLEIIEGPVGVTTAPSAVGRNYDEGDIPDTTVGDFDDVLLFTMRDTRTPFARDDGTGTQTDVAEVAWFVHGNRLYRRVRPLRSDRSLADLTRRENRTRLSGRTGAFPFLTTPPSSAARDFWTANANNVSVIDPGGFAPISPDEVMLNNVIGFDVKVFDPRAGDYGDYVDLGYNPGRSSHFSHAGDPASGLTARTYDTWSTTYLSAPADPETTSYPPPYPVPLRGIQVKIRIFEPDSRLIREVTVIQDFVPR